MPDLREDPAAALAAILDALAIPHVFVGAGAVAVHANAPATEAEVVLHATRFRTAELLNRLRDEGLELDPVSSLRALDRDRVVREAPLTLRLPLVPALEQRVLERSVVLARGERRLRVARLEDCVLEALLSFEERDRALVEAVIRSTPGLDLGYVAIALGLAYPPESERSRWLATAARG